MKNDRNFFPQRIRLLSPFQNVELLNEESEELEYFGYEDSDAGEADAEEWETVDGLEDGLEETEFLEAEFEPFEEVIDEEYDFLEKEDQEENKYRITNGGFGKALEDYTKTNDARIQDLRLLRKKSGKFMRIARTLDRYYVFYHDRKFKLGSKSVDFLSEDGRLLMRRSDVGIKLPDGFFGKRSLVITSGGEVEGSVFAPHGFPSPGYDTYKGDRIYLAGKKPFIQEIVHEAIHAYNFVTGRKKSPRNIIESIHAHIEEEIKTRKLERVILSQIPYWHTYSGIRKGFHPIGSTVPEKVERDFAPGIGLTYLEAAFFSYRLQETKTVDGLTNEKAEKIRERVSKWKHSTILLLGDHSNARMSQYASVYFDFLTAKRNWELFFKKNQHKGPEAAKAEEALLQRHAKLFFEDGVQYQKVPAR
jgi:hypothetical protein